MSHYKHLTRDERESLLFYVAKGYSITEIARELGRSKSTISRELRRNSVNGKYLPSRAEAQYQKRRKKCRKKKLLEDEKLWVLVRDRFLNQHWSPEEIAGRIDLEDSPYHISYRTIYRGIYSGLFDTPEQRKSGGNRGARRKLRHKGKPRRGKGRQDRRGKLNAEYDIRQRPEDANARTRLGDWEADTVIGKLGGACLLTLVDRKSRFLLCRKMDRMEAKSWRKRWWPPCRAIRSTRSRPTAAKNSCVTRRFRKSSEGCRFISRCHTAPGSEVQTRIPTDSSANFFQKDLI